MARHRKSDSLSDTRGPKRSRPPATATRGHRHKGETAIREVKKRGTAAAAQVENLLGMDEAIERLKTTRSTFYRWLRSGKIKGMKVGRQWRFDLKEIERFLRGGEPEIELRADITPLVEDLRARVAGLSAQSCSLPADTAVQQAVKLVVELGLAMGASDIHLSPHVGEEGQERVAALRYRVDGTLHPVVQVDIRLMPALIEQWKVFVGCDTHETKPQDGRLTLRVGDAEEPVDARVNFLPTALGESLTVRILSSATGPITFDRIDYLQQDKEKLERWTSAPSGLIIVSGPIGCGKTTVLYACLKHIAKPALKIATVEDPIEHLFPWMVQTQVNEREGITYPSAMRAVLRSDPDVILAGHLGDKETLQMAQTAALTGHLVLSTLHSNEAAEALARMLQMCGDAFAVSDTTKLVVVQRLVRVLCPDCKKKTTLRGSALTKARELAQSGGLDWDPLPKAWHRAVGCAKCNGTGYRGRNVVAELLEMTPEIAEALHHGASAEELRTIAVGQGMTTIAAHGVCRAAEGQTTLEEVTRVLGLN